MNFPELVARLSLPVTAGISLLLARRVPSYRPVAETLVLAAVFDLARGNFTGTIFSPPLLLAFPCLSASLALKVLAKLPRWPVGLAWGVLAGLTLLPVSRAFLEPLGRVYGAVHVVGLLVQVFGIWRWSKRMSNHVDNVKTKSDGKHHGKDKYFSPLVRGTIVLHGLGHNRKDAPQKLTDRSVNFAPFAVLILFAGDLAALFGPFAAGDPRRDWYVANAQTILLFLVFNVWQVCQLRRLGGRSG